MEKNEKSAPNRLAFFGAGCALGAIIAAEGAVVLEPKRSGLYLAATSLTVGLLSALCASGIKPKSDSSLTR